MAVKKIDLKVAFERGWFFYGPTASAEDVTGLTEVEPAEVSVEEGGATSCGSIRAFPDFSGYLKHARDAYFNEIHLEPYAAVRAAVERELDTKVFTRFSDSLAQKFRAATKFCPSRSLRKRSPDPRSALYTIVARYRGTDCPGQAFRQGFAQLHELMHVREHIPNELERHRGDDAWFTCYEQNYRRWVGASSKNPFPSLAAEPPRAEVEADLFAILCAAQFGRPLIRPRLPHEVEEMCASIGVDLSLSGVQTEIRSILENVLYVRALSFEDTPSFSLPLERTCGFDYSSELFETILHDTDQGTRAIKCVDSLWQAASANPYPHLARAFEKRMRIDAKGCYHNVSVVFTPEAVERSECEISIRPFAAQVDHDVRRYDNVVYSIRYPASWSRDLSLTQRLELLSWFGILERRGVPNDRANATDSLCFALDDVSSDDRDVAMRYAIALDTLHGTPTRYEQLSSDELRLASAGSSLRVEDILDHPILGSFILAAPFGGAYARERAHYRDQLPDLVRRFKGQAVAMLDGQVIDSDHDKIALGARIYGEYKDTYVLICTVGSDSAELDAAKRPIPVR